MQRVPKRKRRAPRPRFKCAAGCGVAVWKADTYCGRPTCRQLRLGDAPATSYDDDGRPAAPELGGPGALIRGGAYDPATAPWPEGF